MSAQVCEFDGDYILLLRIFFLFFDICDTRKGLEPEEIRFSCFFASYVYQPINGSLDICIYI